MIKGICFVLFLCVVKISAENLLILVDVSGVETSAKMQRALVRAYNERLLRKAHEGDQITIYQFSSHMQRVLTWTNAFDKPMIEAAVANLEFDNGCSNWEGTLRELAKTPKHIRPTKIILIADSNPSCAMQTRFTVHEAARFLHGQNIKIYPIGLGEKIDIEWLKQVAGPCSMFGCINGIDYVHRKRYHV